MKEMQNRLGPLENRDRGALHKKYCTGSEFTEWQMKGLESVMIGRKVLNTKFWTQESSFSKIQVFLVYSTNIDQRTIKFVCFTVDGWLVSIGTVVSWVSIMQPASELEHEAGSSWWWSCFQCWWGTVRWVLSHVMLGLWDRQRLVDHSGPLLWLIM